MNASTRKCKEMRANVNDFGPSWRDGIAFNALVHSLDPNLINLSQVNQLDNRARLENAFTAAEDHLGIPRLLDPEGSHTYLYSLLTHRL